MFNFENSIWTFTLKDVTGSVCGQHRSLVRQPVDQASRGSSREEPGMSEEQSLCAQQTKPNKQTVYFDC